MTRPEAFEEYYKLAGFVQAYDGYFLGIKAWGVSVSAAAIGAGFSAAVATSRASQVAVFCIAGVLSLASWASEVMMKMLQVAHVYRLVALEQALAGNSEISGPAYLSSFSEAQGLNRLTRRWRKVARFPHVAFPHVVFLCASVVLAILAAVDVI